jgi:hypothetical protein
LREAVLVVSLTVLVALQFVLVTAARADETSERATALTYATETINLTYSQFQARKLDFTGAGCNKDANTQAPVGCDKPSPHNAFDWTTDGCSTAQAPSQWNNLFRAPCELHDFGYRNFGKGLALRPTEAQRATIDRRFRDEMLQVCRDSFPARTQIAQRLTCQSWAQMFYVGVRWLSHWDGRTQPTVRLPLVAQPTPQQPVANPTVTLTQEPVAPID